MIKVDVVERKKKTHDGASLGLVLGLSEGDSLGLAEGFAEGESLGLSLGSDEGNELGLWVARTTPSTEMLGSSTLVVFKLFEKLCRINRLTSFGHIYNNVYNCCLY